VTGRVASLTLRFLREARAQARIDHPNVCRVYEVGEVSGRAYIALQLIDGAPLHKAAARMSLDEKIAVTRDVALAVQEAHRLGIVHRDLKPANIMVEQPRTGARFPSSWTSAWRAKQPSRPASPNRAPCSAPQRTCHRSRRAATSAPSIAAPMSTASAPRSIAGAEAKFRLREGADPTSAIVAGRAAREEALRLRSDSLDFHFEAARFALQEAAWAARTGGEVTAFLDQARASAETAITIDSQFADAQLAAAEVCLEIAKAQRSRTIADRGIAHVDQALKLNSQLSQAPKLRAELLRVSAR
jgi:protein kinase-like protein